jgi:hypothetical protein
LVAEVIAGLEPGWEVYGLHVDIYAPDQRTQADLDKQFGNNWSRLDDGSDHFAGLDAALNAAIEPRLSELDQPAPSYADPATLPEDPEVGVVKPLEGQAPDAPAKDDYTIRL